MSEDIEVKIQNIVVSVVFSSELNLDKIAEKIEGAEYEPEVFPGLVMRLQKPKAGLLVFRSGKVNCTGARSIEEAKEAIEKFIEILKNAGIEVPGEPKMEVQNIVASADLKREINLDKIAFTLENVEFEPEQFPGLVYRMDDPKVVFLIFRSGKIVCTGARNPKDVNRAVMKLKKILEEIGAF